jgi:hypothetical protein
MQNLSISSLLDFYITQSIGYLVDKALLVYSYPQEASVGSSRSTSLYGDINEQQFMEETIWLHPDMLLNNTLILVFSERSP